MKVEVLVVDQAHIMVADMIMVCLAFAVFNCISWLLQERVQRQLTQDSQLFSALICYNLSIGSFQC